MQLTTEQVQQLDSVYPKLHSLQQSLEHVVNSRITKEITDIQEIIKSIMTPHWEQEESELDAEDDALGKIEVENKFVTSWSMSKIKAQDMNNTMGFVGKLIYQGQTLEINREITWLEAWKYADQIIRMSQDLHHIFIEDFDGSGVNFELVTGS